ncbi:hypothetical protein NQ314_005797, partial [Rhamnusium bicolor]
FARALDTPEIALSLKLTDPKDVIVQKGQSATLRCDAKSSIAGFKVTWFHNDSPVQLNDTRWRQHEDGSLYIPKVVSRKSANGVTGEYQCLVRNNAGALLSGVAKLRVASMDREFTKSSSNLTVAESQPVVLHCSIHSTPPAEIQWEFNNQPLPQHTRHVPLPNGALLITNSQFSDAGSYRCKATNNILNKIKYSKTTLTVFSSPTESKAPTFLPLDISLNNTVDLGENLKLYCAVMGWPTPTVQWLNNDSVVIANSTVLQLLKARERQSGNYTCVAYNTMSRISQTYRVEVQQKPQFNVTPVSKSYPPAKTVRLDCQAKGVPEPRFYWLKDGLPLTYDTRIKKQSTGLVFSHTFNSDSGIYQCVAVNSAGKIWTAAQIEINVSLSPSPPENVQCRPYDSTSICLSWMSPTNVTVQAYSVHSFYKAQGLEVSRPEYVTNLTHYQAVGLYSSTNYTFYVRLYSKAASDRSEKVTCETTIKGSRNLDIVPINVNSVSLKWFEISTDVPCDGNMSFYKVQWRREGHSTINVERLLPGTNYEFRVTSTSYNKDSIPWIPYTHSKMEDTIFTNNEETNNTNITDAKPLPPEQLEGTPLSATSIKLTWIDVANKKFYTICYVLVKEGLKCEDGNSLNSYSNKITVTKLKSNATYEFKVQTHSLEGISGPFSKSIEVQTPADVPSPVLDLKFKVINESTACLRWKAPAHKNGKLQKYIISYTPDRDRPLENWIDISIPSYQRKSMTCWLGDQDTISAYLRNLSSNVHYMVLVRAASDVGVGKPTLPIVVTTNPTGRVIVGVIMALMCIVCCITCILVRRRCLKRRALARARMAASNNYYPAVAHYASHVGAVQVRLEEPCAANFYAFECNGHVDSKKSKHSPIPLRFEEDSNSNVKSSKFYDLYRLFENSKKSNSNYHQCNPHFEQNVSKMQNSNSDVQSLDLDGDSSLNATQLTCLDDSLGISVVNSHRRISPVLGPNG